MTEIIEHKERKKKTKEKERGPSSHNCEILKTTVIVPPTPKKGHYKRRQNAKQKPFDRAKTSIPKQF